MNEFSFKEEDKTKIVEFLNLVAKNATFNMKTDEIINYFKSLSYMQNTLLPKINANIMEIIKVTEMEKTEVKETKKGKA